MIIRVHGGQFSCQDALGRGDHPEGRPRPCLRRPLDGTLCNLGRSGKPPADLRRGTRRFCKRSFRWKQRSLYEGLCCYSMRPDASNLGRPNGIANKTVPSPQHHPARLRGSSHWHRKSCCLLGRTSRAGRKQNFPTGGDESIPYCRGGTGCRQSLKSRPNNPPHDNRHSFPDGPSPRSCGRRATNRSGASHLRNRM